MLTLNNVHIHLQNFGTILGIFLTGTSKQDIEQRYYSFYNHEATGGELEWWSETCALFWIYTSKQGTAEEKLKLALVRGAFAEILQTRNTKGSNPWPEACLIAEERYQKIDHVTWFQTTRVWDMFDMGTAVHAEKGTGNFDDDVLGSVVTNGKGALDAVKAMTLTEGDIEEAQEYEGTPDNKKTKAYGRNYQEEGNGQGVQLAGSGEVSSQGHEEPVGVAG